MPVTVLSGLPGSGKSSRLIETVNTAREQGKNAATFCCIDSPILASREGLRKNRRLACRRPGLTCRLDHFVSLAECADLLAGMPEGSLAAFEEAQFFGAGIVPHWLRASERGVGVLVAMASKEQKKLLAKHGIEPTELVVTCNECEEQDSTTFYVVPGEDRTRSVCAGCHQAILQRVRGDLVKRLREQEPLPGEEVLYQPVELSECRSWRVLRPDSARRAELLEAAARKTGLVGKSSAQPTYVDIGCNTGFFCHRMRRIGFHSTGVDITKGDVEVARILDSFIRRDYNHYLCEDAGKFLAESKRMFDVTSAFSVIMWVMIQKTAEEGIACLERMFAMTRHVCALEMGETKEGHYKGRVSLEIDREWTRRMLETKGGFTEIQLHKAGERGLKRDLFVAFR